MKIPNISNVSAHKMLWTRFWMRYAGLSRFGRLATRFATWFGPPHKAAYKLANMNPKGYIAPSAVIYHRNLSLGSNILIGDRVIIYQAQDGGMVALGDGAAILRDTAVETGFGGSVSIGSRTWIHPRGQVNAYLGSIRIGAGVDIAPNCAFYSYDHGFAPGKSIREQPLKTKGDIIIEDNAWLGVGVTVLSGVHIGGGAVIGAGSLVNQNIPVGAIAAGNPARVVKMRTDIRDKNNGLVASSKEKRI
jgi:acetyltransferase-like isoleucine patch superfamily enzyme